MERVNDNFNFNFPAIMSDGRQFTDYRSNCTLNKMSEQMSSQEYKNYLIDNTEQILSNQSKISEELMDCKLCSDYSIVPPFLSLNCNGNKCTSFVTNPDGIGIARSSIPANKEGFTVGGGAPTHLTQKKCTMKPGIYERGGALGKEMAALCKRQKDREDCNNIRDVQVGRACQWK